MKQLKRLFRIVNDGVIKILLILFYFFGIGFGFIIRGLFSPPDKSGSFWQIQQNKQIDLTSPY